MVCLHPFCLWIMCLSQSWKRMWASETAFWGSESVVKRLQTAKSYQSLWYSAFMDVIHCNNMWVGFLVGCLTLGTETLNYALAIPWSWQVQVSLLRISMWVYLDWSCHRSLVSPYDLCSEATHSDIAGPSYMVLPPRILLCSLNSGYFPTVTWVSLSLATSTPHPQVAGRHTFGVSRTAFLIVYFLQPLTLQSGALDAPEFSKSWNYCHKLLNNADSRLHLPMARNANSEHHCFLAWWCGQGLAPL